MTQDRNRVIIVGGGPVGWISAFRLAKFGIPSVLLEVSSEFPRDLRASTIHPPTLDILEELGVLDEFEAMGVVTPGWQIIHLGTRERVAFDLSIIKDYTRHPYRLQCEQHKLTPLLRDHALRTGLIDFRLGTPVTAVEQHDGYAVAISEIDGTQQRFEGRYLIGADGARSIVRQSLGLELEGFTYPAETTLITTPFQFNEVIPELIGGNLLWTWTDSGSLFHLKDEWRATFYPRPTEPVDLPLTDAVIEDRLQGIWPRDVPYEIHERRNYRIHQRIVANYRIGRVVLAGDAAHLTPPTGGLGMNGGIHDAVNLSEKLGRIMHGEDDALLDVYTQERRPVAQREILAQSHENRSKMQEWDPHKRDAVLRELRAIRDDPERCLTYLLRTSMIHGLHLSNMAV